MIRNILTKLRRRMVVVVESEDGMSTVEYANASFCHQGGSMFKPILRRLVVDKI